MDYSRMPLTPLGCNTMTHNKPETKTSWRQRTNEQFYMCTSQEHYICFNIWIKETRSICISNTVHLHHKLITAPSTMQENEVTTVVKNLIMAILTTKLVQINKKDKQAIKEVNDIITIVVNAKNQK